MSEGVESLEEFMARLRAALEGGEEEVFWEVVRGVGWSEEWREANGAPYREALNNVGVEVSSSERELRGWLRRDRWRLSEGEWETAVRAVCAREGGGSHVLVFLLARVGGRLQVVWRGEESGPV